MKTQTAFKSLAIVGFQLELCCPNLVSSEEPLHYRSQLGRQQPGEKLHES